MEADRPFSVDAFDKHWITLIIDREARRQSRLVREFVEQGERDLAERRQLRDEIAVTQEGQPEVVARTGRLNSKKTEGSERSCCGHRRTLGHLESLGHLGQRKTRFSAFAHCLEHLESPRDTPYLVAIRCLKIRH